MLKQGSLQSQQTKSEFIKTTGPGEAYLNKFKPLEVEVRGSSQEDFERAHKIFKSLVQYEKIISQYKERQFYEKPSDKKRRKRREAYEKRLSIARKERLFELKNK